MSRRTKAWLAAGAAALAALGAAALVPRGHAPGPSAPARPFVVRALFTPAAVSFGDRLLARVVVTLDGDAVRPSTLRVPVAIAPLTQLGPVRRHEVTRGTVHVVTIEVPVACLSEACLGPGGRVAPAPLRATVSGAAEQRVTWEPVQITGRVTPAELAAAKPPFRVSTVTPDPTFRVPVRTAALVLDGLAALLAALAAAVGAAAILAAPRPQGSEETDELARALRLARSARTRPAPDRRIAAGHLARLLSARADSRSRRADDLAWSRPAPTGESLDELVDSLERKQQP
jgi:hypothetical protein